MLDRTAERFGLKPQHLVADSAYGSAENLAFLVKQRGIEPHIPVFDKSDDSASLFLDFDRLPGGGRLIVTTLDPHVHNGERFMPATRRFLPLYDLSEAALVGTDILYVPNNQDQFFLRERQDVLLAFLARGGHLIINSEPAIAWLPFLGMFEAVPPRPFTNIKVRVKHDPLGFSPTWTRRSMAGAGSSVSTHAAGRRHRRTRCG